MDLRRRVRPVLDVLEDRTVPATSALVSNGNLLIASNSAAALQVTETAAGAFTITDNGVPVTSVTGVTGLVRVTTTNQNDSVAIDLGGFSAPGGVSVFMGGGTNSLTISNGTITGALTVAGFAGTDTVTLGAAALTVKGAVAIGLDGGRDTLTVGANASLAGNVAATSVDVVNLAAGSSVGGNAVFYGDNFGTTLTAAGSIGKSLALVAPPIASVGPSSVTLAAGATVGQDVVVTSSLLNTQGNSLTVNGAVAGSVSFLGTNLGDTVSVGGSAKNLFVNTRNGNDTVTLGAASNIGGVANILVGVGTNAITFGGTIGAAGSTADSLVVYALGKGTNTITLAATAVVNGNAKFTLGGGVNKLDVRDAATVTGTLTASGGGNALSVFRGSTQPTHLTLVVSGFGVTDGSPNP